MFTINVVHEVRWLPNDVEAKLDRILKLLEADPAALKELQEKLKASNDALDTAVKSQQQ